MSTAAGDARTTYILQKKYNAVGCYVCKAKTHTHLACPERPCYLCKNIGHLSYVCPFRLKPGAHAAALRNILQARKKRGRILPFLRSRETDPSSETVHPSVLYLKNPQFKATAALGIRKVHSKRITAAEWHPEGGHFVTGDKSGIVRVWSIGDALTGASVRLDCLPKAVPASSHVHHCNLTGFAFDPAQRDVMYSTATDGMVYKLNTSLFPSAKQQESIDECVRDQTTVLNMNPDGWHQQRNFKMGYGIAFDGLLRRCLYIGASNGDIWRCDPREEEAQATDTLGKFHKGKVTCINVNPVNGNLLATASNDKKVCLWDARKFSPGHPLGWYEHRRPVSSAYFSPNTGAKLLTTSLDNRIRVWGDVHGFSGDVILREDVEAVEIIHSHDFHRYLNAFKAVWDPKDWQDDLFMCGRFMGDAYIDEGSGTTKEVLLHPIDMFSASSGSLVHSLVDPVATLICTTNRFSPVSDIILTAASGDIVLWAPPLVRSRDKKRSGRGRPGSVRDANGDSSDDDEDSDGDDNDANDVVPRKKRKMAVVMKKARISAKRKPA